MTLRLSSYTTIAGQGDTLFRHQSLTELEATYLTRRNYLT